MKLLNYRFFIPIFFGIILLLQPMTMEIQSVFGEECTPDPFGYGEIVVIDKWGSAEALPDNAGYLLHWGWQVQFKDVASQNLYPTQGIIIDYDVQGYDPGSDGTYTNSNSKIEMSTWTLNPGTFTHTIVDFDNFGSYCGDGDTITISTGTNNNIDNSSIDSETNTSVNEEPEPITHADLEIVITNDDDDVSTSDLVYYMMMITNHGPNTANDVVARIALPLEGTYHTSSNQCEYLDGSHYVTCNFGNIGSGDKEGRLAVIQIKSDVSDNTVLGTSAEILQGDSFNTSNNQFWLESPTVKLPVTDLEITINTDYDWVEPLDNVFYKMTVTNHGPNTANDVVARIALPMEATYVSSPDECEYLDGSHFLTCNFGDMEYEDTETKSIYLTTNLHVPYYTVMNTQAEILQGDNANISNNRFWLESPEVRHDLTNVDLSIEIESTKSVVDTLESTSFAYWYQIKNHGLVTAENVRYTIDFSDEMTYSHRGSVCPDEIYDESQNRFECNLGSLSPNEEFTRTVLMKSNSNASPGDILTALATVSTSTPELLLNNNQDTAEEPAIKKGDNFGLIDSECTVTHYGWGYVDFVYSNGTAVEISTEDDGTIVTKYYDPCARSDNPYKTVEEYPPPNEIRKRTELTEGRIFTVTIEYRDGTVEEQLHGPQDEINALNNNSKNTSKAVPAFVKNNAKWWSDGLISDKDFASGIGYMVKTKLINVENMEFNSDGELSIPENFVLPPWIKNNASWWSQGLITDEDFKSGIKHMIDNKVISFD